MSSETGVHFIGGPLNGKSLWMRLMEINFEIYKVYPTSVYNWAYGIPRIWDVDRLGWSNASSQEDEVETMIELGKQKIAQVTVERGSLLLPLTIVSITEEIELVEGFKVIEVNISALAAIPS